MNVGYLIIESVNVGYLIIERVNEGYLILVMKPMKCQLIVEKICEKTVLCTFLRHFSSTSQQAGMLLVCLCYTMFDCLKEYIKLLHLFGITLAARTYQY